MKAALIVDDSGTSRCHEGTLLRNAGFEVRCAINGEEGIQKALEFRPSIILMDYELSGDPKKMDGLQCCEKIKANPLTQHCTIIMVSGYQASKNPRLLHKAFHAGCDSFLDKPVDEELLLGTIKDLQCLIKSRRNFNRDMCHRKRQQDTVINRARRTLTLTWKNLIRRR